MPQLPFRPCAKPHNRSEAFVPWQLPQGPIRMLAVINPRRAGDELSEAPYCSIGAGPLRGFGKQPLCICPRSGGSSGALGAQPGEHSINVPVDDPPKSGIKKPGVNRASSRTSCEYANNTDLQTPVKRLLAVRPSIAACIAPAVRHCISVAADPRSPPARQRGGTMAG